MNEFDRNKRYWIKVNNRCPFCGKLIKPEAKTCAPCFYKTLRKNPHNDEEYTNRGTCQVCGGKCDRHSTICKKCYGKTHRGENSLNWKGGRVKMPQGYILIYAPNHPRANARGQVREHIFIWEQANDPIPKGWHIHHINGIKDDNRLENLMIMPSKEHNHLHKNWERAVKYQHSNQPNA